MVLDRIDQIKVMSLLVDCLLLSSNHSHNCATCCCCCFVSSPSLPPTRQYEHTNTQDKRLKFCLNGNRVVIGTLRGYDAFLNVVLEETEQEQGGYVGTIVVRGNSIQRFEALERADRSA